MHSLALPAFPQSRRPFPALWVAVLAVLLLAAGAAILAQVAGDRGIAPVASSTDIEVRGIQVNVTGNNPDDAREKGWREAIRLAWAKIDGPKVPDSQLEDLVSAIVVEQERLGPRRYVATLHVIFDRQRAGGLLGAGGERARSAPMLTLPVLVSGGTETMFELRNPWQRAWAEYQFGSSTIDYVRPAGAGGESLLLTYGQTRRRSRAWWNTILDQFSAADVLIPVAELRYLWPGGPVEGHFVARYGPDSKVIAEFDMRADSAEQLPAMLTRAVAQFDRIYARALAGGMLQPDPTLTLENIELSDTIRALLEESSRAEAAAIEGARDAPSTAPATPAGPVDPVQQVPVAVITVQAATPNGGAFDSALGSLRALNGVRGVSVSSTAIGGTSVMQVTFAGALSDLAANLRAQGWQVTEGTNALAISR